MTEHDSDDSVSNRTPSERYRYVEYGGTDGVVSIIQDMQNEQAWIQSTYAVAVER